MTYSTPSHPAPALGYDRYKLIVQVVLGENRQQGVRVMSRCLWDPDTDNYASYSFKNVRGAWAQAGGSCTRAPRTSRVRLRREHAHKPRTAASSMCERCLSSLAHERTTNPTQPRAGHDVVHSNGLWLLPGVARV